MSLNEEARSSSRDDLLHVKCCTGTRDGSFNVKHMEENVTEKPQVALCLTFTRVGCTSQNQNDDN